MPRLSGQVGTPLEVALPSVLLGTRWGQAEAAAGTQVALLVHTGYVGEGCPFEFTVFNETGDTVATLQGLGIANLCAVRWSIPADLKGKFQFLAEATSVSLAGRSNTLLVRAATVRSVEVLDNQNQPLTAVPIGKVVRWRAQMPGIPDGTLFKWNITCFQDAANQAVAARGEGEVVQGVGVVEWKSHYPLQQSNKDHQVELDRTAQTYAHATFQANFSCLGVSVKSAALPVKSNFKIRSNVPRDRPVTTADGREIRLEVTGRQTPAHADQPVGKTSIDPATFDEAS